MTRKERVYAAFTFKETDIVPYQLSWEESVAERVTKYYGSDDWKSKVKNHILNLAYGVPGHKDIDQSHYRDEWGSVWRTDLRPRHCEQVALPKPTLEGYQFPEVPQQWDEKCKKDYEKEIRADSDMFAVGSIGAGIFERAWMMRGFENILMDMVEHPDFVEKLLDGIVEVHLAMIRRLLELPLDGIFLADDWGAQKGLIMGPHFWRKFFKPRFKRLLDEAKSAGKYTLQHCCGDASEIIPEVIEIGLDCMESCQPEAMDIYALKRQFGKQIRFFGGMGTQQMLPFGTPDAIRAETQHLIEEMGKGGGYILASAKPLMPEVPTENAVAFIEAVANQKPR